MHAGWQAGLPWPGLVASYELQILPPSGDWQGDWHGDWPVITDNPDSGLERGQNREGLQSEISCNTIIQETGDRANTKELVNKRDNSQSQEII